MPRDNEFLIDIEIVPLAELEAEAQAAWTLQEMKTDLSLEQVSL